MKSFDERMINIKKIMKVVVLFCSLLMLTACEFSIAPDELIKPPKLLEENEKISSIVDRNIPAEANLESIDSEYGLSAVKLIDVDKNGSEEILVFYSLEDKLNLIVLEEFEATHRVMLSVEIEGSFFEEFLLEDITGNGVNEIVITTSNDKSRDIEKRMSIYSYSEESSVLFQTDYTEYVIEDLDRNGDMDIVIFKGENDLLSADYYRYNSSSSQVEFINEVLIEYFQNLLKPKIVSISEGEKAVLIEAGYLSAREESYATFLSIDESGRLINLLESDDDDDDMSFPYIYSSQKIDSSDINGDGNMEVSQTLHLVGGMAEIDYFNLNEYVKFKNWYGWRNGELDVVAREILIDENMRIRVPESWDLASIVGREEEARRRVEYTFTVLNDQGEQEEILKVIKSESEDSMEGFNRAGEYEGAIYSYWLPKDIGEDLSEYKLSRDRFQKLISIGE